MTKPELTDRQWDKIKPHLPGPRKSRRGGRPPADNRACFEGILWVLRSGARWKDLPGKYPSPSTCWRRLRDWEEAGLWLKIWRTFLGELDEAGRLDWSETFADGSFAPAKKGACVGKSKRGKGTQWMVVADGKGIPLGKRLGPAGPHESTLIEKTLDAVAVPRPGRRGGRPRKKPERLIYDLAADSDPLRKRLKRRGIELICPHRANRTKPRTQDGRKLRRYRRRWKMERTFAWFGNFRRLVVRYDRNIDMYNAFFHVACVIITLRQF